MNPVIAIRDVDPVEMIPVDEVVVYDNVVMSPATVPSPAMPAVVVGQDGTQNDACAEGNCSGR
jgi:hypothetical protein